MELLLFRPAEYERLYNCSSINLDAISPAEKRHPLAGALLVALSLAYQLLYIPCLSSLFKLARDNSCYKFLFSIGLVDVMAIWMCGFLTGIFGIFGVEFCTCPLLVYISGAYGLALWIAESAAEWLLAVNRSLEMVAPRISRKLFDEGNRCFYWIGAICLYALAVSFFTTPISYSAVHFTWLFNPFADYLPSNDANFANYVHAVHNIFLSVALPSTYILFLATFYIKTRFYAQISSSSSGTNHLQKLVFLQVFLLGLLNTFGCTLYLYMQYVQVTDTLMLAATFNWLHIHGLPPLIYLAINKSIRADCLQMVRGLFCPNRVLPQYSGQLLMHAMHSSTVSKGVQNESRQMATNFAASKLDVFAGVDGRKGRKMIPIG